VQALLGTWVDTIHVDIRELDLDVSQKRLWPGLTRRLSTREAGGVSFIVAEKYVHQ